jgi:septum formation protein
LSEIAKAQVVLASASQIRGRLLANAGISFVVEPASIDERALEAQLAASGVVATDEIALALAKAKALAVSRRRPEAVVIGADQVLELDDRRVSKARDGAEARHILSSLRGRTHILRSAVVLMRGDEVAWSHVSIARMTMRSFSDAFLERYLAEMGSAATASVGCYQLEGIGIQLFKNVDGDYFTVLGMPLLPLLSALRALGALDS